MIAVTGANGLLGSFVIRKLLEKREQVIGICRTDSDVSLLQDVAAQITWRHADIMDPVALYEALNGVDEVIHTAASVSINPRRAEEIMKINVEGTRNVVNACLEHNTRRLVHISSVAALGSQKGQTRIDEDNKWVDTAFNSVYAESKYYSELEVFRGQEEGLSTVIVNPSFILAEANWNISSAQFFKYAWQEHPFYISGVMNYVDVCDVSEIVYRLLNDDVEGRRFIVSAGNISYLELLKKISKEFRKKAPYIRVPNAILGPFAFVEGIRSAITSSEPKITRETAKLASTKFLFANDRITKHLNFKFQPIDETLERCCQYYMKRSVH
ncbi:NAD-dependent epimerase/dehydratase family protein [Chryseolinea sp. T2]|uniref:NAD-dependent epimerase/dehydratase family protein n=1 Tax=Chryseolinea sp. T2 TaxID=3129255 RepID=UPI0030778EBA